jgi:hypothetical protein
MLRRRSRYVAVAGALLLLLRKAGPRHIRPEPLPAQQPRRAHRSSESNSHPLGYVERRRENRKLKPWWRHDASTQSPA